MRALERLFWLAALLALFALGRWDHVSPVLQALRDRVRAELCALGVPGFGIEPRAATDRAAPTKPR